MALAEARPQWRWALASPTPAAPVSMTITAPAELWREVERLATATRSTPGDVLTRALGLFSVAIDAAERGQKIGFADRADVFTREIVGLIPEP